MILFIGILNSILFFLIACLHIFWAFGGKWGVAYVLPSHPSGKPSFNPGIASTLIVAIGLLLFAFIMLYGVDLIHLENLQEYKSTFLFITGGIFLIRAIGEFHYVGLTKKIKNTKFATFDTRYYTPLCLWLGISIFLLAFNCIS